MTRIDHERKDPGQQMTTLDEQVAEKAKEIHTDGYAMSIGEVISMYRDGDIDIHPEFQRIFRWNDEQKSRLIESIYSRSRSRRSLSHRGRTASGM